MFHFRRLLACGGSLNKAHDNDHCGAEYTVGLERLPDALIILNQNSGTWTLPLFQYNFKSQYTYDYNMAFASYLIAMVPVMIAYICAQKYIVAGLTQGAVKS